VVIDFMLPSGYPLKGASSPFVGTATLSFYAIKGETMANQQNYNNQGGYKRGGNSGYQQVHLHFHAAPQTPQPQQQPQPAQSVLQPTQQLAARQIPSAAAIDAQFALIMRTILTVIVSMWVIMIPYMAIPFGAAAILYYLQQRQIKKAATATSVPAQQAAANNPLGLGSPAVRQALSSNKRQPLNSAAPQKVLVQPRKRLTMPLKRLQAPFKRLPRP
jgi:hypothetical protein